jgi:CheY-like chemotaxis protein
VATHSRILVVDDDTELRRSLEEVLTEAGYDVSCATNGEEALRALADEREPNAILLDLAMPVMDGWTFRSLQRSDPRLAHIPTVIITASLSADPAQVERLAPDAFLAKPFSLERLIETLRRLAAPADGDHVHAL